MPRINHNTGFALIDTLVALLLFAVLVLAAIAMLLQGMRATHAAALTGRAVDLAADFSSNAGRCQSTARSIRCSPHGMNACAPIFRPAHKARPVALVQPLLAPTAATAP